MQKKGQVTIFIIVAVVLVVGVIGFFILRGGISVENQLPPEAENVKVFVDDCLKTSTEEIIYYIGQGGGYFLSPEIVTESGFTYYYYDNKNYMPTKEFIEEEIALFSALNTLVCLNNFSDFKDIRIDKGELDSEAKISDNKVVVEVTYPLRITKGESSTEIKDFDTVVEVPLGLFYDSAYKLFGENEDYEYICLSCILEEAIEKDFYVNTFDEGENTKVFIFSDKKTIVNNETFEFIFANEYNLIESEVITQ